MPTFVYLICYTGLDGLDREEEFTGTPQQMRNHVIYIEEKGGQFVSVEVLEELKNEPSTQR